MAAAVRPVSVDVDRAPAIGHTHQHLPARSVAGLRALADRRAADRANQRPGDGRRVLPADQMECLGRIGGTGAGPGGTALSQVAATDPAPPPAEPKLGNDRALLMGTIVLMLGPKHGNDRAHGVPILFSMFSLFNSRIRGGVIVVALDHSSQSRRPP